MPTDFNPDVKEIHFIKKHGSWPDAWHRFDEESKWAIRSAIAAKRPLLLRGEPGIGKSQLARAAAKELGVPFLPHVMNERSERDELLYTYDAVARLAVAQMGAAALQKGETLREKLAETNFICPGVLWWAYEWKEADRQAKCFRDHCRVCPIHEGPKDWSPTANKLCGPVVLIDEIDKADPSVPNGLLESLGNEGFSTPQLERAVRLTEGAMPPLVIITTNEERELPAAFLRRCLVLQMAFPNEGDFEAVAKFLITDRARVQWQETQISDAICREIITDLLKDRENARSQGLPVPGAAEFLDIVRILVEFASGNEAEQHEALAHIQKFAFQKNLIETR